MQPSRLFYFCTGQSLLASGGQTGAHCHHLCSRRCFVQKYGDIFSSVFSASTTINKVRKGRWKGLTGNTRPVFEATIPFSFFLFLFVFFLIPKNWIPKRLQRRTPPPSPSCNTPFCGNITRQRHKRAKGHQRRARVFLFQTHDRDIPFPFLSFLSLPFFLVFLFFFLLLFASFFFFFWFFTFDLFHLTRHKGSRLESMITWNSQNKRNKSNLLALLS
mmetsp:Transcript_30429/g.78772  ORF Transcript_30429/g.78772 Transcript_30429/m.78772 type:complete len:217 (-) Transcript_30429:7281-7931(-)